ncbi:MAG TPA: hypothetical protein DDW80_03380 [Desulfovibrio sp.]|nr:hypothetical protein [Desulfovibrio sp.]
MITLFKSILFFPMLFLRGFLMLGLRLLGGIFMISAIIMFLFKGNTKMAWTALGFSFASFLVGWFYDGILIRLNPDPNRVLILD